MRLTITNKEQVVHYDSYKRQNVEQLLNEFNNNHLLSIVFGRYKMGLNLNKMQDTGVRMLGKKSLNYWNGQKGANNPKT